ncbi:hypothetical protein GOV04_01370 [Candidatus Woesearchaeota archaeon]|nr:hypothetical protein [Candidatus Woesearchaeota archaeon]
MIKPYKASSEYTSAAAGLMSLIHYYLPRYKLNKENENRVWRESAALPMKGCSIYGLARVAKKQGLRVKVLVGDKNYKFPNYRFESYKLSDVNDATYTSKILYEDAVKEGVEILESDFELAYIKKLLGKSKKLIARLNAGVIRGTKAKSQFIPIIDYKNNNYTILDPREGTILNVSDELMNKAFLSVKQTLHRDNRMIILG